MAITRERLQQSFSEGGAQEIYLEVKQKGDFLGFAKQYVFDDDVKVARSALWGLTKAKDEELAELKLAYRMCQPYPELMDELKRILEAMEIDYYKPAVKGLRTKMLCLLLQNKTVSL